MKRLDEVLIVLGTGILAYNIFNFSSTGGWGRGGEIIERGSLKGFPSNLPSLGPVWEFEYNYVAYYYPSDTLQLIAIGAMLLVGGLLVMRRRRHNK